MAYLESIVSGDFVCHLNHGLMPLLQSLHCLMVCHGNAYQCMQVCLANQVAQLSLAYLLPYQNLQYIPTPRTQVLHLENHFLRHEVRDIFRRKRCRDPVPKLDFVRTLHLIDVAQEKRKLVNFYIEITLD
jgi:hypothetical protein